MTSIGQSVVVKVPATTANLGPGFDTLGLSLSLYDELTVTVREEPGVFVEVIGVGAGSVPTDETNLVVTAIAHTFAAYNEPMPNLDLVARNSIPHGRGMGSSGAAIVSGIMAAKGLLEGIVEIDSQALRGVAAQHQKRRSGAGDNGCETVRPEQLDQCVRLGHRARAVALVQLVFGRREQQLGALDERCNKKG